MSPIEQIVCGRPLSCSSLLAQLTFSRFLGFPVLHTGGRGQTGYEKS